MMLNTQQENIIEQAARKAGGLLEIQTKKSTKSVAVYYIRASDRVDARRNVQNHLKSKKIKVTEKKTSLSSENISEFEMGNYTVRIAYKPRSGGMTETTLNSTITELVPCLAYLNNIKERNPEKLYDKILKLPHTQMCYVNPSDQKAGVDFIEDMPKSSKFKEKLGNAVAITKYLEDTHAKKRIKNVFWTYRAKPVGVPANSPADIVIKFVNNDLLGVSLKAGGESTKEPLLNTYVNKVYYHFEPTGTQIKRLRKDLYDNTYSKIGKLNEYYDETAFRPKTFEVLEAFERDNPTKYEKYYDANLAIIRNKLGYTMTKDFKKFKKYCFSEILKKSEVPVTIIKAFGLQYKEVKDSNRLAVVLNDANKVEAKPSKTSKQNFDICLYNGNKLIGTMNMAVRSNKVGVQHKLGQFFNLAVKYNGLKE